MHISEAHYPSSLFQKIFCVFKADMKKKEMLPQPDCGYHKIVANEVKKAHV
jgi:hypothetical protein